MNRPSSDSTATDIRRRETRQRAPRRRGAVLIIVLIVLTVATTLFAIWGPAAVRERRQADVRLRAVQANWLVESGIDRAVARLRIDNDYAGETWQISANELGGRHAAAVTIRVETPADAPQQRTIHVQADHPPEAEHRVRRSKTIRLNLN